MVNNKIFINFVFLYVKEAKQYIIEKQRETLEHIAIDNIREFNV